ncbi:hypothetical protein ACI2L1_02010 [Streptomyces sp. NPDC019531]|uniref:hypothetical protein n=1 Tax=Streptomyces sp. NPDC019531 TaxID=3365062 RepID=UPI003850E930
MSRPVEYESGVPNVYQPQPGPAPAYEEYTDPAAAHGWQNAYDATAELPRLEPPGPQSADEASTGPRSVDARPDRPEYAGPEHLGRADRRRAAHGTGARHSRRVVVAAGAIGVVSAAALVVGLSLSDSSSNPSRDGHEGAPSAVTGTDGVTAPASSARPAVPGGSATSASSPGASASTASSAAPEASASPSAGSSSAAQAAPSSSASPTSADGPGNSGKGRGQGATKGPK